MGRLVRSKRPNSPTFLDDVVSGAVFIFSTTKEVSGYSGSCLRVRRVSDGVEQDIGFSGKECDAASLTTFISGTTGRLVTWYNQSDNTKNATQSNPTRQMQVLVDTDGKVSIKTTSATQGVEVADNATFQLTQPQLFMCRMRPNLYGDDESTLITYGPTGTYNGRWGLGWISGNGADGQVFIMRNGTATAHSYGASASCFDKENFFVQDCRFDTLDLKLEGGIQCSFTATTANITYGGTNKIVIGNAFGYDNGRQDEKFRAFILYPQSAVGVNREAIKDQMTRSHGLTITPSSLMNYTDGEGFTWQADLLVGYNNGESESQGMDWVNEHGGYPWSFQRCTNVNNGKLYRQYAIHPDDIDQTVTWNARTERAGNLRGNFWLKGTDMSMFCQFRIMEGANIPQSEAGWFFVLQHHTGGGDAPDNLTLNALDGQLKIVMQRDEESFEYGTPISYTIGTWYAILARLHWSNDGVSDTAEIWMGPNGSALTKVVNLTSPSELFWTMDPGCNWKEGFYCGQAEQNVRIQFANHDAELNLTAFSGYEVTQPDLPTHA